MDWTTVVFLGMGMVSLLILMSIIIFGTRKTAEYKELQKTLGKKSSELDSDTKALWKALKASESEKEKILERLKNLEAIVTSEAYEAITAGEEQENIQIHLDEEEPEELNDADKAAKIAKRVR